MLLLGLFITGFLMWLIGSALEKREIEDNIRMLDEWRRNL